MKQETPWYRLIIEAFVIVGSILLAFAIDAWWEDRSERQLEQELLIHILDGIRATDAGILATYDRIDVDHKNLDFFFNASEPELLSIPRESLQGIMSSLHRANTFNALAMLQTVEIGMIRDSEVRAVLNRWVNIATEISQFNHQSEYLAQAAMLTLGRHLVVRQYRINGLGSLAPKVDVLALRNDEELMAIVSAMKSTQDIQRTFFLSALQKLNRELEQLLTPSIE
jgi:hypothetical protein